jgi:acyl carrier protein
VFGRESNRNQQRGKLSEIAPDKAPENTPESIQQRVLRVIATTRRVPLETVRPDSTFEELGIDSLDRINILFELEGEFDIEIDDEQAKQVTTLQQMIEGITLLLAAKEAGTAS